jgi:hypothetical protein
VTLRSGDPPLISWLHLRQILMGVLVIHSPAYCRRTYVPLIQSILKDRKRHEGVSEYLTRVSANQSSLHHASASAAPNTDSGTSESATGNTGNSSISLNRVAWRKIRDIRRRLFTNSLGIFRCQWDLVGLSRTLDRTYCEYAPIQYVDSRIILPSYI